MLVQAFARRSRVALALALLSAARPGTADTVWTNLTGTLRWNNPLNWSAGVPDATDLVRFPTLATPAPIVLLDQDMQARALAFVLARRMRGIRRADDRDAQSKTHD